MAFRENLTRKVQINQLVEQVEQSLRPADPPRRIDRSAMQALLALSDYTHQHDRDLDLYWRSDESGNKRFILVLDNELKLYHTTMEDAVLRKSPTVKEMVSIRNAIKILNDKDVVVSRKTDTLQRLQRELIGSLDLSFTPGDIEALANDGRQALKNGYSEGVIEIMTLFAELLGWIKVPKAFQLPHHQIWGAVRKQEGIEVQMAPLVLFNLMHLTLKMLQAPVSSLDKPALTRLQEVGRDQTRADLEGAEVWDALGHMVLSNAP